MLKHRRGEDNPQESSFAKFTRIFGLVMTLVYVALGLYLIFAGDNLNFSFGNNGKYLLGGILILYGVVRFIRVYKNNARNRENRYED